MLWNLVIFGLDCEEGTKTNKVGIFNLQVSPCLRNQAKRNIVVASRRICLSQARRGMFPAQQRADSRRCCFSSSGKKTQSHCQLYEESLVKSTNLTGGKSLEGDRAAAVSSDRDFISGISCGNSKGSSALNCWMAKGQGKYKQTVYRYREQLCEYLQFSEIQQVFRLRGIGVETS